jgi:hypothetical protein
VQLLALWVQANSGEEFGTFWSLGAAGGAGQTHGATQLL